MNERFYGKYRGLVTSVTDPEKLGRIQAQVPDLLDKESCGWALPALPFTGKAAGLFALPSIGSGVWIEFEQGDLDYPIWSGCYWTAASEVPEEAAQAPGKKFVLQSERGQQLIFDDSGDGSITLQTAGGQKIVISGDGIEIDNGKGAKLSLTNLKTSINGGLLEVE